MTLRASLYKIYWWLERRITPKLKFSQYSYEEVLTEQATPGIQWLDLGCGRRLLPAWRQAEEALLLSKVGRLIGTDLDLDSLKDNQSARFRIMADAGSLPFPPAMFDLVSANMVVEHLAAPDDQFREIARVVKAGGRMVFITPNAQGFPTVLTRWFPDAAKRAAARLLEQRAGEDVFPTHYRLNTARDVRDVAGRLGLKVVALNLVSSSALFALFPPLAIVELLWIRLSMSTELLARLRPVLIVVLEKPGQLPASA